MHSEMSKYPFCQKIQSILNFENIQTHFKGMIGTYLNHIGDLECFFYMEQAESPVPNRETKDNFTHEKTKRVAIQCHKGEHYYL